MKRRNDFITEFLELGVYPQSELWIAHSVDDTRTDADGSVRLDIRFVRLEWQNGIGPSGDVEPENHVFTLQRFRPGVLRFTNGTPENLESPMIELSDALEATPLAVYRDGDGIIILDNTDEVAARFNLQPVATQFWSDQIAAPFQRLTGYLSPDGKKRIPLASFDQFVPTEMLSLPLGFVKRRNSEDPERQWLFSFHAGHEERFFGTGERFHAFNLRGQTIHLENTDALGVNNRRAYKNIPFYLSSAGYGLFIHSSAHITLSLADISTRSAQGLVEDDGLDLFLIGGSGPEEILRGYRRITGFPARLPRWSYGTWMSRMTYFSDEEITGLFTRMRDEDYPCDVIHIDTGWFARDWVCEWTFSEERFPDPSEFMKRMRRMGYRVSLWQTPNIGRDNRLLEEAREKKYLAPVTERASSASDFSNQDMGGQIDFTNPDAVAWYKGLLTRLFDYGASVIKTDFGENISFDAEYRGMPARLLHNLYALLYQKAAFEATKEYYGQGIIWARSSWAGSQRYPLHWGGDAAASYDGMAASLIGGLQLGLSGFAYWSHDVPGFHGLPDFMNNRPDALLYLRWTQFGVLSSHLRYHGTCAREPWEYPEVEAVVRQWLRFRYALIPYLEQESAGGEDGGMPMLRALFLQFPEDPACWEIKDQYMLGSDLLVAPVMNEASVRNVYLPDGLWMDFWTGKRLVGGTWIRNLAVPISRVPLYVRFGSEIPFYPEAVTCTDDMTKPSRHIGFNEEYSGYKDSFLGDYIDL